ncbi:ABC transporter substrate-binding protein [Sediminispirochaeta bajacaliforniensis]|uniref:ABC transporter substrate-binding protein n=1 Tax=Sediminispirochaeta bajacaliforniensis TaxID=148 RepID=UPI000375D47E|nr:ABC transporter substrate-binding protein [Sediminispirochaeta bajacaliforniensis]
MNIVSCVRKTLLHAVVAAILMLTAALSLFAGGATELQSSTAEMQAATPITDLAGRVVNVKLPAERIVLASSRHLHEFAAVGGAEVFDRICGWGSDLKLYDMDTYRTYKEAFPQIDEIRDIGYHYKGTFSLETVVGLAPDVVVFPLWLQSQDGIDADIESLAQAGIPVVYIDYYIDPFKHPVPSTLIIGQLLGKQERAKEITDYYEHQIQVVTDRLNESEVRNVTAYIESGSKGSSEYGNTYSSTQGLGALIATGGGTNIADGIIQNTGPINPEYLLEADPDAIIISGSYWPANETSMRLGYHAEEASSRVLLENFTHREGWEFLKAVQNKRVYGLFHGFSFRIYNFAGIQAVACWLHPELFADVDPAENFREFHERFMPVPYSGVWMLGLDD